MSYVWFVYDRLATNEMYKYHLTTILALQVVLITKLPIIAQRWLGTSYIILVDGVIQIQLFINSPNARESFGVICLQLLMFTFMAMTTDPI